MFSNKNSFTWFLTENGSKSMEKVWIYCNLFCFCKSPHLGSRWGELSADNQLTGSADWYHLAIIRNNPHGPLSLSLFVIYSHCKLLKTGHFEWVRSLNQNPFPQSTVSYDLASSHLTLPLLGCSSTGFPLSCDLPEVSELRFSDNLRRLISHFWMFLPPRWFSWPIFSSWPLSDSFYSYLRESGPQKYS